jgi:branched-chain amino acid transport system substrate-binding protein
VGADVASSSTSPRRGRLDKLKGKKIALVYHDSPYGKEPIPLLQERAKMHGFDLQLLPVATRAWSRRRPGCRSARAPDYVFLCGAGA